MCKHSATTTFIENPAQWCLLGTGLLGTMQVGNECPTQILCLAPIYAHIWSSVTGMPKYRVL